MPAPQPPSNFTLSKTHTKLRTMNAKRVIFEAAGIQKTLQKPKLTDVRLIQISIVNLKIFL